MAGSAVIVCGSRNWKGLSAIARELRKLPENTLVIEGEQPSARLLKASKRPRILPIGNGMEELLALFETRRCLMPFWRKMGHVRSGPFTDPCLGKGTKDMVSRALDAGILVRVFLKEGPRAQA